MYVRIEHQQPSFLLKRYLNNKDKIVQDKSSSTNKGTFTSLVADVPYDVYRQFTKKGH